MTISSSLRAGVAGLSVNATRLATISDNIANSATNGYKRAVADFHSMVINGNSAGVYSAGGVRVTSSRVVDERGPLITTANPTDISVTGRGMLPVTRVAGLANPQGQPPLSLVTTGSFRPDEAGYLRTSSGLVLMGWPADADGEIPGFARDTAEGLEPIRVTMSQFGGDPTTRMQLALNLPATATEAGAPGDPFDLPIEYFGNLGTSERLRLTFTPTVPATGASNTWTLRITDSASDDAVVGEYTVVFDDSRADGGRIQSVTTLSGGAYDAATGRIALTVGGGPLDLEIGAPGRQGGITQLSDQFAPVNITKDGSPVGNLTSVEIDRNGMVHAIYDVGFSRRVYQVPLIDVPNPNGLISENDQTYSMSPGAGPFFLWEAGTGPTGGILGFSQEESATDVANELTRLIETQRAYSSNAKVIQTVDEMLQETTNLKR